MARTSIYRMKPRKKPILDDYILASVEGGHVDGHFRELVYDGVEDLERAREIKSALHRSAKYLGYSLKARLETDNNGKHAIRFHAITKEVGRAYIIAKANGDPANLDYNPYGRRRN